MPLPQIKPPLTGKSRAVVTTGEKAVPPPESAGLAGVINATNSGNREFYSVYVLAPGKEHFQSGDMLNIVLIPKSLGKGHSTFRAGSVAHFEKTQLSELELTGTGAVVEDSQIRDLVLRAQAYHGDSELVSQKRVKVFEYIGDEAQFRVENTPLKS